ncbi:E3 binding domain-containing protein [Solwaraspora sp. WMMA2101]|uniref:E3 binding domain-containing protein n=1 Tax=Solwaraspora sp. WMMA2101 TaxID=3404124 RepID=UPI003B95C710
MTRQQHSPRVRRLAGEHGVDLAGLRGTGPAGRVRPADVLAAAAQPVTPSAAAAAAVPTAATVLPAGSGRTVAAALVEAQLGAVDDRPVGPLAAVALLRALRRTPLADTDGRHLAVLVDGADGRRGVRVLRDAGDLNPAAVARRLADPDGLAEEPSGTAGSAGDGPAPAVALCDSAAAGLLHEVPQLPAGLAAVVSVGAPVERPTVVRHDGQPMLAIGAVSTVGIVHDPARITPAAAHALLGAVRAELETLRSTTNRSG